MTIPPAVFHSVYPVTDHSGIASSDRDERVPAVLVADPISAVADRLSDVVKERGLKAFATGDADEAVHYLRRGAIDIGVIDVTMCCAEGESLVDYVKMHFPDVPVIATSADTSWETAQRVRIDGGPVFFYALKPVEVSEIREALMCAAVECARRRACVGVT